MKKLLFLILILSILICREVKADPVYTDNAVWIQNEGWPGMNPNVLSTNLTKVINDLNGSSIKYAFVFVGYWNEDTNDIDYQHDDAYYTNVINSLHQINVKAIAWAESYGEDQKMDIRAGNRQNIYNSIVNCMNKGFDGYNDDIESIISEVTLQDQIYYWNNLTPILHAMNPIRLNMPDVGLDWLQNTNQYLHVDYIVSMFYGGISAFEQTWGGVLQGPGFWQEEFGEYGGHNTPPASPIIIGLMNYYGNQYPLAWQLGQVDNCLDAYGHPNLVGFSLWLYEYMGTNPDDWSQWNYWINRVGTNNPPLHTITLNSMPITGVKISYNNIQHCTPNIQYGFNGTSTVIASLQTYNETHFSLFGDPDRTCEQEGYDVYTYAGGPYNLTSSANVSSIYIYCAATGNVKLAIYNATIYDINETIWIGTDYHPYMLLTQSNPTACTEDSWKLISVPTVTLPAGIYFIAIKGDTAGIIGVSGLPIQEVGGEIYGYDQFITQSYSTSFDQIFPTLTESLVAAHEQGAMGSEPSVYIPTSSLIQTSYNFDRWEDDSDTTRKIDLNSNMTLTAYYTTDSVIRKISGILKDKNNQPLQGKIIAYQNGTNNIISSTQTNSSGHYSLQVPNGTYDIQFNLTNFYIPDYSIKLNSINITNDTQDLIKSITGNQTDNKVSIILDVNNSQNIEIHSTNAPTKIKKNNTYISSVSSLSQISKNTWFYQSHNLYMMVSPEFIVNAASGSAQDIQVAVNQVNASGGGTVYIPEGDFLFNPTEDGAVKIPGGVNLVGAGKNRTILRNIEPVPYADWGWGSFFSVDGSKQNGKSVHLSGFTIIGFRELYPDHNARTQGITIRQVKDFIVSDVKIKDTGGSGISVIGWRSYGPVVTQGVITHCDFINTNGLPMGPGAIASGPNVLGYGVQVDGFGIPGAWIDDISQVLGKYDYGQPVVYIEDCYFSRWRHCIASNQVGHYVSRYNTFDEYTQGFGDVDAHGAGYGNYGTGTRAIEVYNNTFMTPTPADSWTMAAVFHRGGGGVYFNNTIKSGRGAFVYFTNDGTETNETTNPKRSEIEKYFTNDVWIWNNNISSGVTEIIKYDPEGLIIEGVNYHLNASTFNYVPYTYPHPLTLNS